MTRGLLKTVCPLIQPYHCWIYTPKRSWRKKTCTKIFIAVLFVVAKKMENEGISIDWGMAEDIVVSDGDGILLYSKE